MKKKIIVCPNCGERLNVDCNFCPRCQHKFHGVIEEVSESGSIARGVSIGCFSFIAILLLFGACASCIGDSSRADTTASVQSSVAISDKGNTEQTQETYTIPEATVYDGNKTIIKTTGTESQAPLFSDGIDFYFENNSDKNYSFTVHACSVNGYMIMSDGYDMDTEVAAGKKASNKLYIPKDRLEYYGIQQIEYIDILFWAYADMFKDFETNIVRIEVNGGTTDTSTEYSPGEILYDKDGLIVDFISKDNNSIFFGVTNTSSQYFSFDIENVSVNDWTYDSGIQIYDEYVLQGTTTILCLEIDSDFLSQNNIEEIKSVEFGLNFRPADSYFDDFQTGAMSINIE